MTERNMAETGGGGGQNLDNPAGVNQPVTPQGVEQTPARSNRWGLPSIPNPFARQEQPQVPPATQKQIPAQEVVNTEELTSPQSAAEEATQTDSSDTDQTLTGQVVIGGELDISVPETSVDPDEVGATGSAGGEPPPGQPPEGPPRTPERGPEWETELRELKESEWIWSPEFRKEGRRIARAILKLEKLPNEKKYNAENGSVLNGLYLEWIAWCEQKVKQSEQREAFDESSAPPIEELGDLEYTAEELKEAEEYDEESIQEQPTGERDLLEDKDGKLLPALKDKTEKDGSVTEGLWTKYKRLRKEGVFVDQVNEIEVQLGRYFKEAERLGLLGGVDASLRSKYRKIREEMVKKNFDPSEILDDLDKSKPKISKLGEDFFEMVLIAGLHTKAEIFNLEGVWDVYTDRAIERFRLLANKAVGGLGRPTINGEYNFNIDEVTFSVETGEQGLRRFLPTDIQFRDIVERDISTVGRTLTSEEELLRFETEEVLRRLADDDEDRFNQLVNNRNEAYGMLVRERELRYRSNLAERQEAMKNLAGDRDAYRRLAIDRELYWSPTYANYYEVYAETPEQFQKAVDTFTQWLRSGLTKSPNELFQRVSGFKDALTTAGLRASMDVNFLIGLRQELEGMVGVLGANHSNEIFNPDYMKQFLDFLAADEGPARMVRLGRAYRGKISALFLKFDNDPELELFFATYGSRGQLFEERTPTEMHRLRDQIRDKIIEEMLGVDIKGYDPLDPHKRIGREYLEQNLSSISRFQSDEETINLFEGFNLEDQEKYYRDEGFQRRLQMLGRAKRIQMQLKAGRRLSDLNLMPQERADYLRYRNGKLKLTEYEDKLVKAVRIRDFLDQGFEPGDLKKEDKGLYEMYMETSNAVDLAMEMYGIMGEKSKRRGGIYLVDRNPVAMFYIDFAKRVEHTNNSRLDVNQMEAKRLGNLLVELRSGVKKPEQLNAADLHFFREVSKNNFVDYLPNNRAEQVAQFAENWTKATYGGELDPEIQEKVGRERLSAEEYRKLEDEFRHPGLSDTRRLEIEGTLRPKGITAGELKYRVGQARRMAIWALKTYGHDTKLWDFTLLQNGKPVDPNTLGYYGYHQNKKGGGKENEFIAFGQDSSKQNDVEKYRYCVPQNPRILGYNKRGEEVILVFDAKGRPVGLDYDNKGKAEIYNKSSNGQRIIFDNLDITTEAKKMRLKTPILKENSDGSVERSVVEFKNKEGKIKRVYRKPIFLKVDQVHVDFQTAVNHVYSRWTGHPYWGYQEEDTGLILSKAAFAGAKRVKAGLSRPEDEKPHATQLLIVDPTLERVGHFKHKESRVDKIVLNAVEESNMGHWRIRDELNQVFLPDGPDVESARTAFNMQDDGGSTKQWENAVFEFARWPNMKIRRARSLTSVLPLHFASMSEIWGSGGALNTIRMFGYKEYKMVGLFAFQKWVAQTHGAQDEYNSLAGFVSDQEGKSKEGAGEKFTNDSDKLDRFITSLMDVFYKNGFYDPGAAAEDTDIEFMNAVRESLNRFEITIQKGRVLETDMRGERAPLWLEGVDIFERNTDGSIKTDATGQRVYNQKIDENRDSGSSRHNGTIWFWRGVRWLMSGEHWEGQETYPGQAIFYDFMNQYTYESIRMVKEGRLGAKFQTHWEWLLGKMVR